MWVIRALLALAAVIVIGGFLVYNGPLDQRVTIDLYWKRYEDVRLIVALFWGFVAGMVTAMLLLMGAYIKQLSQLSSARKIIKGLKAEVAALRNRPIEEPHDLFNEPEMDEAPGKPANKQKAGTGYDG